MSKQTTLTDFLSMYKPQNIIYPNCGRASLPPIIEGNIQTII